MEWQRYGQTSPDERVAASAPRRVCASPVERLESEKIPPGLSLSFVTSEWRSEWSWTARLVQQARLRPFPEHRVRTFGFRGQGGWHVMHVQAQRASFRSSCSASPHLCCLDWPGCGVGGRHWESKSTLLKHKTPCFFPFSSGILFSTLLYESSCF